MMNKAAQNHATKYPPFEIVDYDPAESIVRVRLDGRWALFDHLGHRLTEFGDIEAEA